MEKSQDTFIAVGTYNKKCSSQSGESVFFCTEVWFFCEGSSISTTQKGSVHPCMDPSWAARKTFTKSRLSPRMFCMEDTWFGVELNVFNCNKMKGGPRSRKRGADYYYHSIVVNRQSRPWGGDVSYQARTSRVLCQVQMNLRVPDSVHHYFTENNLEIT